MPYGAHPGAGALLGEVTGERVSLYSGHPAGEGVFGILQCPRADAWQELYLEGAIWFPPRMLQQTVPRAGPDAACAAPEHQHPPPRPHTALCSFPPPLLFFPAGCEKVQSACDRFSSLPSPFLLVKTAILEQPSGLVKGYL